MAAIPYETLLEESKCYQCFGPVTIPQQLKLALLRRWLLSLDANADTGAQALVEYSKCYACLGASMYDLMELALLGQISELT